MDKDCNDQDRYDNESISYVIGVDEAGRGPLAGPVVAAACCWKNGRGADELIEGIIDSKKITKEDQREELYKQIMKEEDVLWAVTVVSPQRIDEVNIFQASMQGMQRASEAIVKGSVCKKDHDHENLFHKEMFSAEYEQKCWSGGEGDISSNGSYYDDVGCYVVSNSAPFDDNFVSESNFYCLIDGNRVPNDMPCESESIVTGDGKEYCIAAASIIAKVTRDRIMHDYFAMFPEILLSQHKGYPTKAHMNSVNEHGASTTINAFSIYVFRKTKTTFLLEYQKNIPFFALDDGPGPYRMSI